MGQALKEPIVYAFTFARAGSKGLPNKNIKPLDGRPLIAHAIESSKRCTSVRAHIVSTDSESVAAIAREAGAEVPFVRPAELATDDAPEILAWKHAIEALRATGREFDLMLSVPATSPLRRAQDLDRAIALANESRADLVITVCEARSNPYFNMVELDEDGRARVVCGQGDTTRRQTAPTVYEMTTVAYVARPEYVLETESLMQGDVRAIVVPADSAIDIDDELDFAFAEFLIERRRTRN